MVKKWLRSSLKLLNFSIGVGGITMIIYGVLMIRVWQLHQEDGSSSDHLNFPWFIRAFLGVGIALCAATFLGHIAAHTADFRCLSSYIIVALLLLMLETVITAEGDLNTNLKKDFVVSNDDIWRWFLWSIYLTQEVCLLLATILRTLHAYEVGSSVIEEVIEQPSVPLLGPFAPCRLIEPCSLV